MLTEIKESTAIVKMRILVESDIVKHLKTFKIACSEIPVSLLVIFDDVLVVCKFIYYRIMSGYLYFSNNLKCINDHIYVYMESCKIFSNIMVTVLQKNMIL